MLRRVRASGFTRRITGIGPGFVDSFLRDNKVIPPVLAVLALLIFSWVVAGVFVGKPHNERVSNQANVVAQTPDNNSSSDSSDSPAPQVESRNADSYAAYQSKDPFHQILTPASASGGSTTDTTNESTNGTSGGSNATGPNGTSGGSGASGGSGGSPTGTGGGGTGGGSGGGSTTGSSAQNASAADSDGDGLSNRKEKKLGLDPNNPDTNGNGITDGREDVATGGSGSGSGSEGGQSGSGSGGNGGGGKTTGGGGLIDSGGNLPDPSR